MRRDPSFREGFIDLIAKLPWWVGVLLAAVTYLLLHAVAVAPAKPPGAISGRVVEFLLDAAIPQFARIGQYLVPLLCLMGALFSYVRQKRRARPARVDRD